MNFTSNAITKFNKSQLSHKMYDLLLYAAKRLLIEMILVLKKTKKKCGKEAQVL